MDDFKKFLDGHYGQHSNRSGVEEDLKELYFDQITPIV